MHGDTFELQRIERGVVEISPCRRRGIVCRLLPGSAIIAGKDRRTGAIKVKRVRVSVEATVVTEKSRATVSGFLHAIRAGIWRRCPTASISAKINFARVVGINGNRDVVEAL